jgi:hypothetical protein
MLQARSNDGTDDAGDYRIENLTPGTYYVQVQQQPVFGWGNGIDGMGSNREVYPEEFYANAPDLASATALQLKPGESAQVDFTLSPKTAFRVSGTLTPAAPNGIFVSLQDAGGDETQVGIQFNPRTGRWMVPAVPPGGWNIVFRGQDQPGDAYYAEQRVDVGNSDIENLQVVLQPLPPIPVQVLNAPEGAIQPVQVQLIPQNARFNRQQYGATPDGRNPSGPLFLKDVTPGTYNVMVQPNGPACVESIESGNVDLTREPLVVALGSAPQPIQVTERQDCANLDVTVQSQDHAGMVGLILVSDSQAFEPKVALVSGSSRSAFGPLTPGTYHLYAVSNLNGLEYSNPEAMRGLEGQEITLTPNQQGTASITVAGSAPNE